MSEKIEGLEIKYINNKQTLPNVKSLSSTFIEFTQQNYNDNLITILNQLRELLMALGFSYQKIDMSYIAILKAHIEYLKENYNMDYNLFEDKYNSDMTIDEYLHNNGNNNSINIENKVFENINNFKYEVNNNSAFLNFIFDHLKDEFNVKGI